MKVRFNKKIYSKEAIEEAIEIYKELAKFKLKETKNYFVLEMKNILPKLKPIFKDEFCNYVLALTKK